jgi:hypothetical protein
MKQYRVLANVVAVSGFQTWIVEADSPEDAIQRHKQCLSEFESESIEVMQTEVRIEDVEELQE